MTLTVASPLRQAETKLIVAVRANTEILFLSVPSVPFTSS